MSANLPLRADGTPASPPATPMPAPAVEPLLVPAEVASALCGRSKASWWRDHAAGRVPAPTWRAPGRTLWSVDELRRWITAGCPDRRTWEALRRRNGGEG